MDIITVYIQGQSLQMIRFALQPQAIQMPTWFCQQQKHCAQSIQGRVGQSKTHTRWAVSWLSNTKSQGPKVLAKASVSIPINGTIEPRICFNQWIGNDMSRQHRQTRFPTITFFWVKAPACQFHCAAGRLSVRHVYNPQSANRSSGALLPTLNQTCFRQAEQPLAPPRTSVLFQGPSSTNMAQNNAPIATGSHCSKHL